MRGMFNETKGKNILGMMCVDYDAYQSNLCPMPLFMLVWDACSLNARGSKCRVFYANQSSKASPFTSSIGTISSIPKVPNIKIVPKLYSPLRSGPCT